MLSYIKPLQQSLIERHHIVLRRVTFTIQPRQLIEQIYSRYRADLIRLQLFVAERSQERRGGGDVPLLHLKAKLHAEMNFVNQRKTIELAVLPVECRESALV